MTADLIARCEGSAGILSLNRPQALHALTVEMVRAMTSALLEWRDDLSVKAIMIDHAEGRGFCAGGDVALVRHSALNDGGAAGRKFFFDEYRLNALIFDYTRPVVAFMDGITMGGGVGIAMPAKYRVATEHTRFAMPETGIGLFPDVGGGWYLSRLSGRLGQYLALTGARLDGAECLWAGLATHYLSSSALKEAKSRIAAGHEPGGVLSALSISAPEPKIAGHLRAIAKHFAPDRLEEILVSLDRDDSEWAAKELATLRTRSPLSSKVTLRQLAESAKLSDFHANMAMEYRIAARAIMQPDFAEGVRAVLVDKDHAPKWSPATPEAVNGEMVDAHFAPLPKDQEWTPL